MALGKKHTVELNIKRYMQLIIGDKKVGKTALVADLATEIYGDIGKLLIVSMGKEKAYEAIHNAVYEEPQDWDELMELVDELVDNIDNYDFDMVSFDTIDEIIPMAEAQVIKMHTMTYKEVPKSFNACFGSYGEPRKKVQELISELLTKLDTITHKTGVYFIGHNKVRPMKSKLDTEDYYVVSSNLSLDYFNMFAYKCPIICNIIKEVETDATGKTEGMGNNKKDTMMAGTRDRMMYLRDSGAVEAGGRFKGMPEKVLYGARNYHDAIIDGIKNSISVDGAKLEVEKPLEKALVEKAPVVKEPIEKAPTVKVKTKKQAIAEVIEKAKELTSNGILQNDIMAVLSEAGYANPNSIPSVEVAEAIVTELNKLG